MCLSAVGAQCYYFDQAQQKWVTALATTAECQKKIKDAMEGSPSEVIVSCANAGVTDKKNTNYWSAEFVGCPDCTAYPCSYVGISPDSAPDFVPPGPLAYPGDAVYLFP